MNKLKLGDIIICFNNSGIEGLLTIDGRYEVVEIESFDEEYRYWFICDNEERKFVWSTDFNKYFVGKCGYRRLKLERLDESR